VANSDPPSPKAHPTFGRSAGDYFLRNLDPLGFGTRSDPEEGERSCCGGPPARADKWSVIGVSYVILTRDRPATLARTLGRLSTLHESAAPRHSPLGRGRFEFVVVENAARCPARGELGAIGALPSAARWLTLAEHRGAAARNAGVALADPAHEWVVMLDDDSAPVDLGFISRLDQLAPDTAALSADIWLPGLARRETGGLPEVFVNCGVAIRRQTFLDLGGYDPSFASHAVEYDLAARMLLAGLRVVHDPWFRVEHRRTDEPSLDIEEARPFPTLVRNNAWIMQRYAPASERRERLREARSRYRRVAEREHRLGDYARGLAQWRATIREQPRCPMSPTLFDRFTGLAHARDALSEAWHERPFRTAALADEGRNAWAVRRALEELGVRIVPPEALPEVLVIATLAPGPMLDALERRLARPSPLTGEEPPRVLAPWKVVMDRLRPIPADVLTGGFRASADGRASEAPAPTPVRASA
jgi:hypothetical protein